MKRGKAAQKRQQTTSQAELEQLAETVRYGQQLIGNDEAEALVKDNETCSAMIRASTAQEQLYFVMLAQYDRLWGNPKAADNLQNQAFVVGDLIMKAFALGLREGRKCSAT